MAQRNKGPVWRRYASQRNSALQRGIPWLFSFEEWCAIWLESGKWDQRGRHHGQYVMARFGDRGPYERSNIRICLVGENVVENTRRLPVRGCCLPGYQAKKWADATPDQRARWRPQRGSMTGRVHREQSKGAMSDAATGRRMVVRDGVRCWARPGDADYPG